MLIKYKNNVLKGWKNSRLVWFSADIPDLDYGKVEKMKEPDRRTEVLNQIADKIKDLKLNEGQPIKLEANGKAPQNPVTALKNSLKKQIEQYEKTPSNPKLGIKNLDQYLLDGLQGNISSPAQTSSAKLSQLSDWMKNPTNEKDAKKKTPIVGYKIVDGQWEFLTNINPPTSLEADFKMDDQFVDTEGKKIESTKTNRVDLSKEVNAKKEEARRDAKFKEEAMQKADQERLKPENLEKIISNKDADFNAGTTLTNLAKELADNIQTPADSTNLPIKAEEIQVALQSYIDSYAMANNVAEKGPALEQKFFTALSEKGFTKIAIENGNFVFKKANPTESSKNPFDLKRSVNTDNGDKIVDRNATIHSNLDQKQDEQTKAEGAKEKKDKVDAESKPSQFDEAEEKAKELLKIALEANLDPRFLPAAKAILSDFKYGEKNPQPVKFEIPFNDGVLACQFSREPSGRYVLKFGKADAAQDTYMPFSDSKTPIQDMQKFFLGNMQTGEMLQRIQTFNIKDKALLQSPAYGLKIDEGPDVQQDGSVKYEFDWSRYGYDPDVTMKVESNGQISVKIEVSGIGLNGENVYEFKAGGLQDMVRSLKALEKWDSLSSADKAKQLVGEKARRQFEAAGAKPGEGPRAELEAAAKKSGAGEILNIRSIPEGNGYLMRFDWLEKQFPGAEIQVAMVDGVNYKISYLGGAELGIVQSNDQMMKLIAGQRENFATKGGAEKMKSNFESKLPTLAKGMELRPSVEIKNLIDGNPGKVMLAMTKDLPSKSFNMDTAGLLQAAAEGYLIKANPANVEAAGAAASATPENPLLTEPKPVEAKAVSAEEKLSIEVMSQKIGKLLINETAYKQLDAEIKVEIEFYLVAALPKAESLTIEQVNQALIALANKLGPSTPLNAGSNLKAILAKLVPLINNPAIINDSFKSYFEGQKIPEKLNDKPISMVFLAGLIDQVGTDPEGIREAYAKALVKVVEGINIESKPGVKPKVNPDLAFRDALKQTVMDPAKFKEKYNIFQAETTAYKAQQDKVAAVQTKTAEYEESKKPNAKTFEEFDKQPNFTAISAEARTFLKAAIESKALSATEIALAKTDNTESKVSFNINKPGMLPYTLTFSKTDSKTVISVAEGWNNATSSTNLVDAKLAKENGFDPVKLALDQQPKFAEVKRDLVSVQDGIKALFDKYKALTPADKNKIDQTKYASQITGEVQASLLKLKQEGKIDKTPFVFKDQASGLVVVNNGDDLKASWTKDEAEASYQGLVNPVGQTAVAGEPAAQPAAPVAAPVAAPAAAAVPAAVAPAAVAPLEAAPAAAAPVEAAPKAATTAAPTTSSIPGASGLVPPAL